LPPKRGTPPDDPHPNIVKQSSPIIMQPSKITD